MRLRVVFSMAAAAVVLLGSTSCSMRRYPTEIHFTVAVHVCPPSSSDCYDLRVPNVEVNAVPEARGSQRSGVTNEAGDLVLTIDPGVYVVTARTFVVKSGQLTEKVTVQGGQTASAKLVGEMVALS